jgi:hypothetical protein
MTGSISGPRRRSSSWLKISEDSREIDSDWRVRYREGLSLDPASARAVVAAPSFRIDNPDIPYAHATIIIEPLLITRDTIFGRQHLDNSQRSARGELFDWLITSAVPLPLGCSIALHGRQTKLQGPSGRPHDRIRPSFAPATRRRHSRSQDCSCCAGSPQR